MGRRWRRRWPNSPPASGALAGADQRHGLGQRVATGLVLLVVAIAVLWTGGLAFAGLAAAAVLLMFAEWAVLHRLPRLVLRIGLVVLGGAMLLAALARLGEAALLLGFGAAILFVFAGTYAASGAAGRRVDRATGRAAALGLIYCGLPGVAIIWLRGQPYGLYATLLVLACVWGADIAAFFVGRALRGPRLAPTISPGKTWSGAAGGLIGAVIVAALVGALWPGWGGMPGLARLVPLALVLAVASILGDLYESSLKRRAGVKDSGTLLPGHGGVLDRLDGLVPAAVLGAGVFWMTGWAG